MTDAGSLQQDCLAAQQLMLLFVPMYLQLDAVYIGLHHTGY